MSSDGKTPHDSESSIVFVLAIKINSQWPKVWRKAQTENKAIGKLHNRLASPCTSRQGYRIKNSIFQKKIFATKKNIFFKNFLKKRQWGMKYASSIVWKKLTVTVVKLISSLSWSYCQKEHSYFNTLLMHYYDFFGWLFFRNVGCFVLEKYRFL